MSIHVCKYNTFWIFSSDLLVHFPQHYIIFQALRDFTTLTTKTELRRVDDVINICNTETNVGDMSRKPFLDVFIL